MDWLSWIDPGITAAWLGLLLAFAAVVLLPLLPAIQEWRQPSDVVPLPIDSRDAQEPAFLANSFAVQLADALAHGRTRLGESRIAQAPVHDQWPLKDREWRRGVSKRLWHAEGDTVAPAEMNFLAEIAAPGNLDTADGRVYRALWAGQRLHLASHATVLRWAHGAQVNVASGARLAGRVSAEQHITVWGRSFFTLLHAPQLCFGTLPDAVRVAVDSHRRPAITGLPAAVSWNATARRGTIDTPLQLGARSAWRGDLVCRDDLTLGWGCHADGALKAHGTVQLGEHVRVEGGIVAEGPVLLGARCVVLGSLVSETAIELGSGCVIGAPGRPATVAAPRIEIGPGVVVHGTVWASERGQTRHDVPQQHELEVSERAARTLRAVA